MNKRLIGIVLILCMALAMMPISVKAAMPTAYPSTTSFVMNGKTVTVPEAYTINGTNYLQLRGIAALLKGTQSQFNVYWDRTIIIEPGKPYTGTATPAKLAVTNNVTYNKDAWYRIVGIDRNSTFQDAYYIDGDTNYVQLRYFAKLLNGTSSQFNVYWDAAAGKAVIEPGKLFTGVDPNYAAKAPSVDMVHVPAGTYTLGYDGYKQARVTLTKGYHIGKYEVTQEQYQAVMGTNPSYFDGSDDNWVGNVRTQMPDGSWIYMFDLVKSSDGAPKGTLPGEVQAKRPVESVSWYDTLVFCNKLSILSNLTPVYSINGQTDPSTWGNIPTSKNAVWDAVKANWDADGYRLPTEAEWQVAAQAGTTTYYSFASQSDVQKNIIKRDDYVWNVDNSSVPLSNTLLGYTHEVGKRLPNPWGLYDTLGNVDEWCWDLGSTIFPVGIVDPVGPSSEVSGDRRVKRGGNSQRPVADMIDRSLAGYSAPNNPDQLSGFRVVKNDSKPRITATATQEATAFEGYFLVKNPEKLMYKVGESFDPKGLLVHFQDKYGKRTIVDNSELSFYSSGTVRLTPGRPFTTEGVKKIEVLPNDRKVTWAQGISSFEVKVMGDNVDDILADGDYYMQIYGKYIYPIKSGGIWLELSDKKPDKPFTVKLKNHDDKRGPQYTISYDGAYIYQSSSANGDQLQGGSGVPHMWRINKYSSFYTVRDYGSQKLLVNASGQKKANGTKVTVWTYTGSAPDHGKIKFIKD